MKRLIAVGCLLLGCGVPGCNRSTTEPARKNVVEKVSRQPADLGAEKGAPSNDLALEGPVANVREIVSTEELLIRLTPKLKHLNHAALNLSIPDFQSAGLFDADVRVSAIRSDAANSDTEVVRREDLDLFQPVVDQVSFLAQASFYLVRGENASKDRFKTEIDFHGLGRTAHPVWKSLDAKFEVVWRRVASGNWLIAEWNLRDLRTAERRHLMFQDAVEDVLGPRDLRRAKVSRHSQIANQHYYPGARAKLPGDYADQRFFPISTSHHPGLSVVDIDRDGHDDLYVSVRWGNNLLFRNRGDGTFEEVAAQYGLNIEGRSNAAVFADFDNDDDTDVMIARSLARSLYLVNEDGKYVDRSSRLVSFPMPYEATSVSAADVNNDGLLDVYFSTYHQDDISRRIDADLSHPDHRIHGFLTKEQSAELKWRHKSENQSFVNQVGPPNILLVNQGEGKFRIYDHHSQVAGWRNSFQSSWSDFDQDGDSDLYIANDFAPDFLLRNDGTAGFTDISKEYGLTTLGFGMGVSWGDFNGDGFFDVYVSNMYSKAGKRITKQVPGLNSQFEQLALGNHLFQGGQNRLTLVSTPSNPKFEVAKAGWSWGGQFFDFDNDGFLDIYVPNGYYTAPDEFASSVDL